MKKLISLIVILIVGSMLSSCSTTDQTKRPNFIKPIYGKTSIEEITALFDSNYVYKVQFRLHENDYTFLQYLVPCTEETAGFLFVSGKLIAANKSKEWQNFGFENCIVFPLCDQDDIYECLLETTNEFIASGYPLHTLTFDHDDNCELEPWMFAVDVATMTVGAPIVLGAAVAFGPFVLIDYREASETYDELATVLRLGEPIEKYENIIQGLPDYAVSRNASSVSLLIREGVFFKIPIYSIGFHGGRIIWIAEPLSEVCYERNRKKYCKFGNQDRLFWTK